ncbi:MAG: hypothetical protein K9J25_09355 [Bacteroidales bacterium]|nr:hypothetical protein [Bacteroidales bacterium]
MNKLKLKHILNIAIIAWLVIWIYYLAFNWEVFSINLKTNLGFAVIGGYPFVFFFLIGLLFLILIKYFDQSITIRSIRKDKDTENRIALLEKDIELLQMKETLYKMQSEEMNKSNASLNALHERLDEMGGKIKGVEKDDDKKSKTDEKEDKG